MNNQDESGVSKKSRTFQIVIDHAQARQSCRCPIICAYTCLAHWRLCHTRLRHVGRRHPGQPGETACNCPDSNSETILQKRSHLVTIPVYAARPLLPSRSSLPSFNASFLAFTMADPHGSTHNTSPISQLLHTLGLTRGDLVQRSEEMRQRLAEDDTKPLRALSKRLETQDPKPKAGPSRANPRTTSSSNLSVARSLSPPTTPVKSEPLETGIPHRQLDTMEMVIERKSKRGKGLGRLYEDATIVFDYTQWPYVQDSSAHRRDGRVTTPARLTPSRNDSSQVSLTRLSIPFRS